MSLILPTATANLSSSIKVNYFDLWFNYRVSRANLNVWLDENMMVNGLDYWKFTRGKQCFVFREETDLLAFKLRFNIKNNLDYFDM